MEDGRPFVVSWRGTNSLNEKGTLYKQLVAWRGKTFTQDELNAFELKNLLDKSCMVNVTVNEGKDGKQYAKVQNMMPLPKGFKTEELKNKKIDYDL